MKREILALSDTTGIRKRIVSGESGLDSNDVIAMGTALENLTKQAGWSYVEAYILKNANPVGLIFAVADPVAQGKAQALILLIQWVQQTILAKNDLLERQRQEQGKKKEE
jgi:hypothetical protein